MKKIICMCLAGALLMGLCSCSNSVSLTTAGTIEQTSRITPGQMFSEESESSDDVYEETNRITEPEEAKAFATSEIPVVFTDMSTDEIVDIIQSVRHISTGSTVEDYLNRFTVKPDPGLEGQPRTLTWEYSPEEYDCFRFIVLNVWERDGKLIVDDSCCVDMVMWFSDSMVASGVYVKLVKILTDEYGQPDDDIRDGTNWQTVFGRYSVQMLEADGVHQVRVLLSTVDVDLRG